MGMSRVYELLIQAQLNIAQGETDLTNKTFSSSRFMLLMTYLVSWSHKEKTKIIRALVWS